MKKLTTTHRTGSVLAVLGIACASIAACGADDGASVTTTSSDTTEAVMNESTVDTVTPQPEDTELVAAEPVATESPTTEGTEPVWVTEDGLPYISDPDPAIVAPALAFCSAYGGLSEVDGVDQLMALVSDDIVIEDAVSGETYSGRDAVDAYLTGIIEGEWFFDEALCLQNVVQGAHWAAGPYIWFGGSTAVRQGITAVHLDDDGLIDRQVDFYSARPGGKLAQRIDNGTGVLSIGMQYCSAWGDPYGGDFSEQPDPDRIVSLMSAEPTIHGPTTLTGAEQIRTFAENAEWDRNECSVEVQAVQWEAFANRLFDDDTGSIWEGVNVIALDANELVTDHWPLLEVVP